MSILSDLFNAGTGGVVTGLVGSIVTSVVNFKTQKLKNQHEIAKIEAETKSMIAETNANIKITETQVQGELQKAESEIFAETVKQAGTKVVSDDLISKLFDSPWTTAFGVILVTLLGFIQVLKSAVRPGLTTYLIILTSWITFKAYTILSYYDEVLTNAEALGLFNRVVDIIIYLTVTTVTWWFGDRRTAKFLHRLNDGNFRK